MSMLLPLTEIASVLGCDCPVKEVMVAGAVIDSRKIEAGNLFIALKGEHVDGHEFISVARKAGASAALVEVKQDDSLPQLVVENVEQAFGLLARYWRQQCSAKTVAITGSNGKTTVKEMVAGILRHCGSVVATEGNLNNALGVPLTLARLDKTTDYAVIEMGANHPGEIASLVEMAAPDVAIINNVAAAHLQGFGTIEGVAKAKSEIFEGLLADGTGVINIDMPFAEQWKELLAVHHCLTFSLDNMDADVTAVDIQLGIVSSHFMAKSKGEFHYLNLPVPGKHNVANALAAIAIATAMDIPTDAIIKALSNFQGVPHRLQIRLAISDARLIDDSYNANPGSFQQALMTLANFPDERWLVLGDFGELGPETQSLHTQMGRSAKDAGVTKLFTVGEDSQLAGIAFGSGAIHFSDMNSLQLVLEEQLSKQVTLLLKGSRFMHLDKLADALAQDGGR